MTVYPYEFECEGMTVVVHAPNPDMEIPQYGARIYARRFRAWPDTGFGWIGDGTVDILIREYRPEPGSGEKHEVEALRYIVTGPTEKLRITQLLEAARAGGGEEIGIVGFGWFADERGVP